MPAPDEEHQRGNAAGTSVCCISTAWAGRWWVTNIATHVAGQKRRPVLLFSLEMSEGEIAQRGSPAETPMPGEKMLSGRIAQHDWPKLLATANRLAGAPLYLHDASDVTLTQIRARARQFALHQNPTAGSRWVIVDYLQLMRAERPAETRVQEMGSFSRGLKAIARELGCPVVALSQLNATSSTDPTSAPRWPTSASPATSRTTPTSSASSRARTTTTPTARAPARPTC
jgi:replicative DNA helicase